jgi:hypothetical protein
MSSFYVFLSSSAADAVVDVLVDGVRSLPEFGRGGPAGGGV